MESSDLLQNFEQFLRDQRLKLDADIDRIDKTISPRSPVKQHRNLDAKEPGRRKYVDTDCQTDISISSVLETQENMVSQDGLNGVDHPKYGLPGLGEFEDRYKVLAKEQKKELNRYLSEAIKLKSEQQKPRSAPVDYDELLARKRNEEIRYRQLNDVGLGLRGTFRDGALYSDLDGGMAFQKVRSAPTNLSNPVGEKEIGDLIGLLTRLQQYGDNEHSDSVALNSQLEITRVPNYRASDTFLPSYSTIPMTALNTNFSPLSDQERYKYLMANSGGVGAFPQDKQRSFQEERQKLAVYRKELEEQMKEQKERNKRQNENGVSAVIPLRNIEDSSLRNQLEIEELRRFGLQRNPNGQYYRNGINPAWESNQRVLNYGAGLTLPSELSDSVHTSDGVRKIPETWHDGRWPLPENKIGQFAEKPKKLDYQEELRSQIEDKKRREREEKERNRQEDEKLSQRLENQRLKIQEEYEAEQKRQRLKEEEARLKADQLRQQRERHTLAEQRAKKAPDMEWWEREQQTRRPQVPEKSEKQEKCVVQSQSPPIPTVLQSQTATPTPAHLASPRTINTLEHRTNDVTSNPSTPHRVELEQSKSSTPLSSPSSGQKQKTSLRSSRVSSRPNEVLTQLSAMRRQLKLEQERFQRRALRDSEDYDVYDVRLDKRNRLFTDSPMGRRKGSSSPFDSLDANEITTKNRERTMRLNEWRQGEYSKGPAENTEAVLDDFLGHKY